MAVSFRALKNALRMGDPYTPGRVSVACPWGANGAYVQCAVAAHRMSVLCP